MTLTLSRQLKNLTGTSHKSTKKTPTWYMLTNKGERLCQESKPTTATETGLTNTCLCTTGFAFSRITTTRLRLNWELTPAWKNLLCRIWSTTETNIFHKKSVLNLIRLTNKCCFIWEVCFEINFLSKRKILWATRAFCLQSLLIWNTNAIAYNFTKAFLTF